MLSEGLCRSESRAAGWGPRQDRSQGAGWAGVFSGLEGERVCFTLIHAAVSLRSRLADSGDISSVLASPKGMSLKHSRGLPAEREGERKEGAHREARVSLAPEAGGTMTPAYLFPRNTSPGPGPPDWRELHDGANTEGGNPWGVLKPAFHRLISAHKTSKSNSCNRKRIMHTGLAPETA